MGTTFRIRGSLLRNSGIVDRLKLVIKVVCRDIWALHLELLPSPPPAEPLLHQLDVGGIVRSRVPGANTRREPPDVTNNVNPDKPKNDGESTDSEQGEEDEDSEMERFLQEASESPSETSSDSDGNPKAGAQRAEAKSWRRVDAPTSNVSVLILACWILRIPVMYQDFIRFVTLSLEFLRS